MARRLKLIVAYDGSQFAGWQSQSHGNTIQDHLERAFGRITGTPARVHGAGRTDAGVRALAQCAHVDLSGKPLPPARWVEALNALLPPAIRVLRCGYVSNNFHARLSAKGKIYRYRIWSGPVLPPFEYRRAWQPNISSALMISPASLPIGAKQKTARFAQFIPCAFDKKPLASRSTSMATASSTRWSD